MERRSEHAILDELRDRFFAAGLPPFSTADLRSKLAAAGGDIDAALRQAGVTVPAKRAPAPAPAASLLPARVERSDAPATKMTEPPRVELTISPSPARAPPSNSSARAAPAVVAKGPPKELSFIGGSIDMFRANKLYVLLALVPVSAASEHLGFSHGAIFALACVAILPLAALLGDATEQLALHTNETIGGLLNATFGNATELIICYFLLKSGQLATVQISLLGSILSNSLLVMGFACMAAGMVKREVCFSDQAAGHNTTMLLIAILGISLPTLMVNIGQVGILRRLANPSPSPNLNPSPSPNPNPNPDSLPNPGPDPNQFNIHDETDLSMSHFISIVLLLLYGFYLVFTMTEPQPEKAKLLPQSANEAADGEGDDEDDDDEEEEPILSLSASLAWLVIATIILAYLSELLSASVEEAAVQLGLNKAFVGFVIIPIIGNAAEHSTAVVMARRLKMDLALSVAQGSSTQIALFVVPVMVLLGWAIGQPLDLIFGTFETVITFLSVVIVSGIVSDGKTNWLEGIMLIAAYFLIASAFFFMKDDVGRF